jgi:hypothetical protein
LWCGVEACGGGEAAFGFVPACTGVDGRDTGTVISPLDEMGGADEADGSGVADGTELVGGLDAPGATEAAAAGGLCTVGAPFPENCA